MAISWNLRFGLDAEETRNAGWLDCMGTLFREHDKNMPLFQARLPALHAVFVQLKYDFKSNEPLDGQVWDLMKQLCPTRKLGAKLVMARFQSSLSTGMERRK
eukprot:563647-Pyramimonas_sp.AAC.1